MEKEQEIKLHERVACLEVSFREVEKDISAIKTNHLPHIQEAIDKVSGQVGKMENTFSYYAGMGIVILTIINIAVSVALKFL